MHTGIRERELTWAEFTEEVLPEARTLATDASAAGIERYLGVLAASASRVDPASIARPQFSAYPGYPDDVGFALSHRGSPFLGVQFWIEPGAFLPFHPHPGGSVCTLFLEGAARVSNFEFAEPMDALDWEKKGDVLVRRTREQLLHPGDINLVANPRDNIHGFRAGPKGARGIDITTGNRPENRHGDSLLEIAGAPRDATLGVFEAHWRDS